ncbi:uncharacterized protein LOC141601835 [Silene latifolia]|uniref:uncharacterized protein LOC141601835 n=1 Tax=Silene latifolia TaxID=37657 RepID=UPI003D781906
MDFSDPEFMNSLRRTLENIHEINPCWQPRRGEPPRPVDEFKITELPEFEGGTEPEDYLEWERKIECMFEFKDLSDEKSCKYAILKLSKNASLWYENLKSERAREGKEKITSWETLKRKLRKRYVPKTHKLEMYRKVAELMQGTKSVVEYIAEFEQLNLMSKIEEQEEQKMARFCRGLNQSIVRVVDLQPYASFDMLCNVCLKVEGQQKGSHSTNNNYAKPSTWSKSETSKAAASSSTPSKPAIVQDGRPSESKNIVDPKERSLSRVHCFKCQGFGHFQSACPNKRNISLREAVSIRDDLYDEATEEEGIFYSYEEGNEEEEFVAYDAPIYDTALVLRRTLKTLAEPGKNEQRDQIFHTKCQIGDKWCSVIVDGGSCTNVASSKMVDKLALATTAHPRPYNLHWLDDGNKVKVTKQVRVGFSMRPYQDEVLCDVIPMDACHILLGRPWQFDRNVVHRGRSNEYVLTTNGKKVVLKPMSPEAVRAMHANQNKKPNLTILSSGREEFADVFLNDLPPGLPPLRGIEHQIDLIPGASLPNKAPYRCNPEETKEMQRQIEELMGRGYVRESLSPCAVPTLLVPKKDGTWRMCIDSRAVNNITVKYRF